MDFEKLRGWWAYKQGLIEEDLSLDPPGVFLKSGWCRSVAGCNPYLTAFSRARLGREAVDKAAKQLEISELPAARGCTYVVAKQDFATALACGASQMRSGEMRIALSLGATEQELDHLSEKVLDALETGTKDPAALKQELGDAVRNFGEAGKKKGLTTSLPLALGSLQSQGKIIRRPISGRLDEQRYAYETWKTNQPELGSLDSHKALISLASLFFRWLGPMSLGSFALLAGTSAKAARAACDTLNLVPAPGAPELLILQEDLAEFAAFEVPDEPVYRLISCLDSLILLHSDYGHLFSDDGYKKFLAFQANVGAAGITRELGFNPIVERGRITGLWEFDQPNKEIAFISFDPSSNRLRDEIERTQAFIRDDLGDARTFSLDSIKSRQPKIDRLRNY